MFRTKFKSESTTSRSNRSRVLAHSAAAFALVTATLALPSVGSATIITGTVFLGDASVLVVGSGAPGSCIDFYTSGSPTTCAPTPATIPVSAFVQGGSSNPPFATGANGTIQDLSSTSTALTDFITIGTGASEIFFDLSDVRVNSSANIAGCSTPLSTAGGSTCQPTGSPFQFINGPAAPGSVANTVGVSLTFDAEGYTGTSASGETAYTGIITTQLQGNINTILSTIGAPGGFETSSLSLELFPTNPVTTPEPATFGSIGAGLLGLSFLIRKRISKT